MNSIQKLKRIREIKKQSWSFIRGILIIGICFIILYPLIVKLSSSFMTLGDVYDVSVNFVPRNFSWENYRIAFRWMDYPSALFSTLQLTLLTSFLQLVSCTMVGYGLARFNFKGNKVVFGLVILTLIVPPQLLMVPLFLNFRFFNIFGLINDRNLLGTYLPFVLTSATGLGIKNGLFIYIMKQSFKGMPKSLEEAAYVDGAGPIKTFLTIMLPGAAPVLIIVFLFSFVWQYNDIFYLNLFFRDMRGFLSFGLQNFTQQYSRYLYVLSGDSQVQLSEQEISLLNNAGMILFITPLLLLFSFVQRYFIESIERTGIVG